jgi:predicted nucleotidyltransferase
MARSGVSLEAIKEAAADVAKANGALLALIFGSHARGTATRRSDVDVIFVEDTTDRFLDRLSRYMDPLADRLRAPVEVLVYTPEEFENMKHRHLVKRAIAEGIVAYEHGEG